MMAAPDLPIGLNEDVALERIISFAEQFGRPHLDLAYHAAFPLVLTPDMLYQIWASFVPQAPWTAVADVLLSSLCREVAYELYEIDTTIRNFLLKQLRDDARFGQPQLDQLALFLRQYVQPLANSENLADQNLAMAQQWVALVYTQPGEAIEQMVEAFQNLDQQNAADALRLVSLVKTLAAPMAGMMEYGPLLVYATSLETLVRGNRRAAAAKLSTVVGKDGRVEVAPGLTLPTFMPQEEVAASPAAVQIRIKTTEAQIHNAYDDPQLLDSLLSGLVFDRRSELQGQPGLHALIVGVSAYPHLPGGTGTPAPDSFGMQQLSSSALTAYKMYRWLLERQRNLSVPFATCRLLLSPSPEEAPIKPELNSLADSCTLDKFLTAVMDWRSDASSHKDNVTFFYFAGHGVQRSKGDQVLLLEDFGDGIGGTFTKAVNTKNIYNGMVKSITRPNMAQTQLYFVDACTITPSRFKLYEQMETSSVWNIELSGRDDRRASIFYAAVPGSKAYALKGDQTTFSKALLACLNGAAGESEEMDGQQRWYVSIHSLARTLGDYIQESNQTTGAEQEFTLDGMGGDTIILSLDSPPLVDFILELDPPEALPFTKIEVWNDKNELIGRLPAPLNPYPYPGKFPAGIYQIRAIIDPPNPSFVGTSTLRLLTPPRAM